MGKGELKLFNLGSALPIANALRSHFDAENKRFYVRIYCGE